MAKLVGIDIRSTYVRGVMLRTSYRRVAIEGMTEVSIASAGSVEAALQQVGAALAQHGEAVSTSVDGDIAFIHRMSIPAAALRQLEDVLPFELEAQVPVELDELVYDHIILPREDEVSVGVIAAAARTESVRQRIDLVTGPLGHEPQRVGVGPLPLANLASVCPGLVTEEPIAFIDLADDRSDLLVLLRGHAAFARTGSIGIAGLPSSASRLAASLRQSLGGWANISPLPVQRVVLVGGGASAPGAAEYLSVELGVEVIPLPPLTIDAIDDERLEMLPRFAKALGLALSMRATARDPDLRQDALAFQRGYGFLKQKAPLLGGILASLLFSFVFAAWAESRALSAQNEVLAAALGKMTKSVLGEEITDPSEVMERLEAGGGEKEKDPQPQMDGFDVMVAISEAVDQDIVHDIEELDLSRGQVKLRGIVTTTAESEKIVENLKKRECITGAKITKHNKVVNSDRQKYSMEFDVKCEKPKKKRKKDESKEDSTEEAEE